MGKTEESQKRDYHREPLTGIRFPGDLKERLQKQAARHKASMNDIVVSATDRKLGELERATPII